MFLLVAESRISNIRRPPAAATPEVPEGEMKMRLSNCMKLLVLTAGTMAAVGLAAKPDWKWVTVDYPGAFTNMPLGVNPQGEVVGYYRAVKGGPAIAFYRDASGKKYETLLPPDSSQAMAWKINPRGEIVGTYWSLADKKSHGFLLYRDRYTSFDPPGSIETWAKGINPQGDIVGHFVDSDKKTHGFLLRFGQFTVLDYPDAILTGASGINATGDIVGSYQDASKFWRGWLLRNGEFTSYEMPDALKYDFSPFDISPSGEIAGRCKVLPPGSSTVATHGFLYLNGQFLLTDPPASTFAQAVGINPQGYIVGSYNDAQGNSHGYLLVR
jgi:uncharacterized membrane protein